MQKDQLHNTIAYYIIRRKLAPNFLFGVKLIPTKLLHTAYTPIDS